MNKVWQALSEPAPRIDEFGTKYWYKNGELHRDNDKPAVIWADGSLTWYKNGKLHRDNDKPAIIYANGSEYWYTDGLRYTPKSKQEWNE